MQNLSDKQLFRQQGLIGDQWKGALSGKTIDVIEPATQAVLGTVPDMGRDETRAAVAAAAKAYPAWRAKTNAERAALLEAWHGLMIAHLDDLARILTLEQGKPLEESKSEIRYGASFVKWFAEEARRIGSRTIPSPTADRRIVGLKEPVGVCAIITPCNFPNAMITRKVAPALAAGCTVVIKPSDFTPYSALALGVLAERAGIPAGVINILTGLPTEIGAEIMANETVRKISFTGSTRVGSLLMRGAADSVKRVSLELGGNAPFIVFDDADLELAVEGAIASKFRNGGQTCVCANRILVQAGVYDAFANKLVARVERMKVGPGLEPGVAIGPMINEAAISKINRHVADVLTEATTDMVLAHEETFGPVAPLFRFETDEEAIAIANATPFGLAAYFYTRDLKRSWQVAEAFEAGMVGLNAGMLSTEVAPFSGIKQSGLGREGAHVGIEEYLEMKTFHIGGLG
ncbi:NAD-dependent succinate-semialdehyde dehydrogenase [Bradyrhizobium sp. CCBAU 53421]|uniref:NAD-dependent succinate-semialdehyde dehydrogenase n=1 Tax=Bradyrhizobium sp. CCBAU 53421 TaxID=1325120 RepID=UPI00188B3FA6|nr:NAD-dependent succinate-semialdehyde dehydrogenase [Bradyrhizobium sp. CCBAU 53421]QOZ36423.1 succinate-semialdehyde dehydrogenase (NADP(+)) [Bradyrhizobium sp. CCBAU 53421]